MTNFWGEKRKLELTKIAIYHIFELKKKFKLKEKRSRAESSKNTSAQAMAQASSAWTHL